MVRVRPAIPTKAPKHQNTFSQNVETPSKSHFPQRSSQTAFWTEIEAGDFYYPAICPNILHYGRALRQHEGPSYHEGYQGIISDHVDASGSKIQPADADPKRGKSKPPPKKSDDKKRQSNAAPTGSNDNVGDAKSNTNEKEEVKDEKTETQADGNPEASEEKKDVPPEGDSAKPKIEAIGEEVVTEKRKKDMVRCQIISAIGCLITCIFIIMLIVFVITYFI